MLRPTDIIKRLRQIAEALLHLAHELEAEAVTQHPTRSRRATIAAAIEQIAARVATGQAEGDSIALAARDYGLDLITLDHAWRHSEQQRAAQELFARRYMARALMRHGLSRDLVAEILAVHPNHIARMVSALERAPGHAVKDAAE